MVPKIYIISAPPMLLVPSPVPATSNYYEPHSPILLILVPKLSACIPSFPGRSCFVEGEGKVEWLVTILYGDDRSREEARRFCDKLIERFWRQHRFEVQWYSFDELEQTKAAKMAAQNASRSNLMIFAARPEVEIPFGVREWVEVWLEQRGEREGALVGLFGPEEKANAAAKHIYFREVAHRAGMDYLTQVPETISEPIPDSIEAYDARANRVTSVLSEILRKNPMPQFVKTLKG